MQTDLAKRNKLLYSLKGEWIRRNDSAMRKEMTHLALHYAREEGRRRSIRQLTPFGRRRRISHQFFPFACSTTTNQIYIQSCLLTSFGQTCLSWVHIINDTHMQLAPFEVPRYVS